MVEKPPNALAVTTPFAERMEGCPPSPFPVDGFPPPATVLMVKLCPTQTPRNKKRPQAVFVISIRHFTICGKMADHHYREECFSSLLFARARFVYQRCKCFGRINGFVFRLFCRPSMRRLVGVKRKREVCSDCYSCLPVCFPPRKQRCI